MGIIRKILFVSSIYPYPKDNGKKIILSSIFEYFIEKYGSDNIFYYFIGNEKVENEKKVHLIQKDPNNFIHKVTNIIKYSFLLQRKSIQESLIYNKKYRKDIEQIIKENNIDYVIYDTIRISQMFENSEVKLYAKENVYLDDLFSIRYQKMLDVLEKYPDADINPLGNFKKYVPNFLLPFVKIKFITKLLLKFERNLIEKREVETVNNFYNNLLISNKEVEVLKERSLKENIAEVRPLLEKRYNYNRSYNGKPIFIFLGALNIPHNDFSICYFIEKNAERLLQDIPTFKLRIIGKNPSDKLISLVEKYSENLELCGYVEDLEAILNSACCMIVPLKFGTGVKLKTLEAFSRGVPIISTDYGVEGISVNESQVIIENDIMKFPQHMKLLMDADNNIKYSEKVYKFYEENYTKDIVYKMYQQIFK